MASKKPKSSKPKASKASKAAATTTATTGDHTRMLASKKSVTDFITYVRSCKTQTSEAGQRLTSATKAAQDAGVNIPAARIAERFMAAALRDTIKGRVLWEDVNYYLIKCLNFDRVAPKGMFKDTEVRSTKSSRKKKNGAAEPEQTDLVEQAEAAAGEPESEQAPPLAAAGEGEGEHVVH